LTLKSLDSPEPLLPVPSSSPSLIYDSFPLADENTPRPWEVFVWSSAQPHNVRTMLESTFDPEHIKGLWGDEVNEDEIDLDDGGKVLGVWARDKMGLSDQEYCMSLSPLRLNR